MVRGGSGYVLLCYVVFEFELSLCYLEILIPCCVSSVDGKDLQVCDVHVEKVIQRWPTTTTLESRILGDDVPRQAGRQEGNAAAYLGTRFIH